MKIHPSTQENGRPHQLQGAPSTKQQFLTKKYIFRFSPFKVAFCHKYIETGISTKTGCLSQGFHSLHELSGFFVSGVFARSALVLVLH